MLGEFLFLMEYLSCKVEQLSLDGKEVYKKSIYLAVKEFFQDNSELKETIAV